MAIICFPGLVGKVSTCATKPIENDIHKTAQKSKKIKELKTKAVTIGSTTITPVPTTITIDQPDDGSERDEAEGDDDEMEVDSDEEVRKNFIVNNFFHSKIIDYNITYFTYRMRLINQKKIKLRPLLKWKNKRKLTRRK